MWLLLSDTAPNGTFWRHHLASCCRYESIIATLCENLDTLDEPEAKASMIWIIGEYAERIDNADELLEQFLETFPEETSLVSLSPLHTLKGACPLSMLTYTGGSAACDALPQSEHSHVMARPVIWSQSMLHHLSVCHAFRTHAVHM